MATTTQITVNKAWVKLSDGDCTVQANSTEQFQFAITATEPTTEAALLLRINEPLNLAYKTAVWCRLTSGYTRANGIAVNVIK